MASIISIVSCSKESGTPKGFSADNYKTVKQLRNTDDLEFNVRESVLQEKGYQEFASKMRVFSNKLTEVVSKEKYNQAKNFTFSPLSIELCLGLAVRSTAGTTRQEILDAFDMDYETFNKYYKAFFENKYFKRTKGNTDIVESMMIPTNSIWVDDNAVLKDDCLDALKNDYLCNSFEVDFGPKGNKSTMKAMHDFVYEKTNELLDVKFDLDLSTMFVLMNTVYLKDAWSCDDGMYYTTDAYKFTNANGVQSNKPLLASSYCTGKVMETDDYSAFYVYTNKGRMYFVKPAEGKSIKDVFTKEAIANVTNRDNYVSYDRDQNIKYETSIIFPKFEASSDFSLMTILGRHFNINSLFQPSCDFSSITDMGVFASDIVHVAKLITNENGIEAAAVTYIPVAMSAAPSYTLVQEQFVIDKEFGYIYTSDDDVVFAGTVTNID